MSQNFVFVGENSGLASQVIYEQHVTKRMQNLKIRSFHYYSTEVLCHLCLK